MKSYVLVQMYADRSGVIRAIGPYDSEEGAKGALPAIEDFLNDSGGIWDTVPIFDLEGVFD